MIRRLLLCLSAALVCLLADAQIVNRLRVDQKTFLRYAYGRMQQFNPDNLVLADSIYAAGVAKDDFRYKSLALSLEMPVRFALRQYERMDSTAMEVKALLGERKETRDFYFTFLHEYCEYLIRLGRASDAMLLARELGRIASAEQRAAGKMYSYRIIDPILFYTNVCANVADEFRRDRIDGQLKTEFVDALAAGFGALTALELRPSQINSHTRELKDAMNAELSKDWAEKRGITIVSIGMNPVSLSPEDAEALKRYQRAYTTGRDPSMAGGVLVDSMAGAMGDAASNAGGAMNGFVGMGMGMNMMGGQAANLFAMGQGQQPAAPQGPNPQFAPAAAPADGWTCACGSVNTGKFCTNCGSPKPAPAADSWTCACGSVNTGKFCTNCGSPKPVAVSNCPTCGYKLEPGSKFCPNCGTKIG